MRRTGMLALTVCLLAAPALAATDPGLRGPFGVGRQAVQVPVDGGAATRPADLYFPSADGATVDPAAGDCPVVVHGHGFSRSKDRYTDLGEHLASRGFVVAIPNFVCSILSGCDHSGNADEMSDVITWLLARDADPSSPLFGRLAADRVGTSGHSAGGLQALVCASRDPRVTASAPMDPVDSGGLGVAALAAATAPIAVTYSEPSGCNADGSASVLYAAVPTQKRGVKLVGANHCDPEKDNDFFGCALTCGAWNATRHQRYLRYVTAWFEYYLHCDQAYREWAWGSRVSSDLAAGLITYASDPAPATPTGATAAAIPGPQVEVRRDPPASCRGVDAWAVDRDGARVADGLAADETLWTDAAVSPGTTYRYVLRDRFADFQRSAESDPSNEAAATVPAATGPGEASSLLLDRAPGSSVTATWAPAGCATDHAAVWGTGPITGAVSWTGRACGLGPGGTATFDPGATPPGSFTYLVIVGEDGETEGPYGTDSAGSPRPESVGLGPCDRPRTTAICP